MKRKFVCIVCPNSCHVDVDYENQEVNEMHGVECQKGREYIMHEVRHPLRVLTGSVKVLNGNFPLVSVKTSSPVPKKYLLELGQLTHQLEVEAPVEIGQVIANGLFGEGIELVATRQVKRKIV
jgi:CxxC motif-containing protein